MMEALNQSARELALAGLRCRRPRPRPMSCAAAWPICYWGRNWPPRSTAQVRTPGEHPPGGGLMIESRALAVTRQKRSKTTCFA